MRQIGLKDVIILKCVFSKWCPECIRDSTGSVYGPMAGFFKLGNEPLGFIKGEEYLEQLR
jgi:hypothetical protein